MKSAQFSCFICGKPIQDKSDSYVLSLKKSSEFQSQNPESQDLYSHESCLREITDKSIPLLPL